MQFAVALLLIVASYLISSLLVKHQSIKPAALSEFTIPQAEEGTPQSVPFGQVQNKGWQVLWYGELATTKIKSSGAKK